MGSAFMLFGLLSALVRLPSHLPVSLTFKHEPCTVLSGMIFSGTLPVFPQMKIEMCQLVGSPAGIPSLQPCIVVLLVDGHGQGTRSMWFPRCELTLPK